MLVQSKPFSSRINPGWLRYFQILSKNLTFVYIFFSVSNFHEFFSGKVRGQKNEKNSKLLSNFELWRPSTCFDQLDLYIKTFVRLRSFKWHRNLTELGWTSRTFSKFSVHSSPPLPNFQKVPKLTIFLYIIENFGTFSPFQCLFYPIKSKIHHFQRKSRCRE